MKELNNTEEMRGLITLDTETHSVGFTKFLLNSSQIQFQHGFGFDPAE